MAKRRVLLVATMLVSSMAVAVGTGPTHPENSREHPLDNREPRQDVIEGSAEGSGQARPPTLEAPVEGAAGESIEAPSQPVRPGVDSAGEAVDPNAGS